ncbi:MAG TPA: hypothetical protein VIM55_00110 [Mucilaginibacter sp.]
MFLTITTDWILAFAAICQLFITGVGFWLLYTTFILQAKVARDQQKILEIETRRSRREVRPLFKVKGTYDSYRIIGFTTFDFSCELNDAYYLQVRDISGARIIAREPLTNISLINKGESLIFSYKIQDPPYYTYYDLKRSEYKIKIELTFQDVDGFSYKQIISGQHCELDAEPPQSI